MQDHSLKDSSEKEINSVSDGSKKQTSPVEVEDLSLFCLGRCCLRESCYFATPLLKMRFCPYCASEMKTVYDYYELFQISLKEPFFNELAKMRYRKLLSMFHPDLEEAEEKNLLHQKYFLVVSEAWQILCDEELRRDYRKMLAKCRTSLLMEQDFEAEKKDCPDESPSKKPYQVVNIVLAVLCLFGAAAVVVEGWGTNTWAILLGSSIIFVSLVFFSILYYVFAVGVIGGLFFLFFRYLFLEKWIMTIIFFVMLASFLHFFKKWREKITISSQDV